MMEERGSCYGQKLFIFISRTPEEPSDLCDAFDNKIYLYYNSMEHLINHLRKMVNSNKLIYFKDFDNEAQ
jgi:hypothetical protein